MDLLEKLILILSFKGSKKINYINIVMLDLWCWLDTLECDSFNVSDSILPDVNFDRLV